MHIPKRAVGMQARDVNCDGPPVAFFAGSQNFNKSPIVRQALDLHFDGRLSVEASEAAGADIECRIIGLVTGRDGFLLGVRELPHSGRFFSGLDRLGYIF